MRILLALLPLAGFWLWFEGAPADLDRNTGEAFFIPETVPAEVVSLLVVAGPGPMTLRGNGFK